jgi:hypothetical protein
MPAKVQTPDEAFKEFTRRLGKVLRSHGFKGSGQNFRRESGAQWQAINIQKSQWRVDSDDPIVFYVNIGVQFPGIEFKRFAPPPAAIAKFTATKADLSLRIDELFPEERLTWFAVDGWTLEKFWKRFSDLIVARLVPLLTAMNTPEGLARVLRTMPWMATPGARLFVGRKLAPPLWDPAERDAGLWKQDKKGLWWGPGEW